MCFHMSFCWKAFWLIRYNYHCKPSMSFYWTVSCLFLFPSASAFLPLCLSSFHFLYSLPFYWTVSCLFLFPSASAFLPLHLSSFHFLYSLPSYLTHFKKWTQSQHIYTALHIWSLYIFVIKYLAPKMFFYLLSLFMDLGVIIVTVTINPWFLMPK